MTKRQLKRLTPLEALIMDAVWKSPGSTVREIQEGLQARKPMAYNTVLTMMRILREKGYLESVREGRVDVYRPLVSREQAARGSLREVMDQFFAGSAAALVNQLIDAKSLDKQEIEAIRREIDRKLAEEKGGGDA